MTAGGPPDVDDEVLSAGPPRRAPRLLVVLAVVAVAAAVGGYLVGHGRRPAPAPARTVSAAPRSPAAGPAELEVTDDRCSAQVGTRLQLGVEVVDPGPAAVVLRSATPTFPLGGLTTVSTTLGPCRQTRAGPVAGGRLGAGGRAWLTVTVRVRVRCPRPLPVLLDVRYLSGGQERTVLLPAFGDLGDVAWSGCRSARS